MLIFLVSIFFAYEELQYATGSKTTLATIDGIQDKTSGKGRGRYVQYHYRKDDGDLSNARAKVDNDFVSPPDGKFAIDYITDGSRPAGSRNWAVLIVFFGSLAAILVSGFMFWRHVRDATRPSSASTYKRGR